MTMHEEFNSRINDQFKPLSYDELMVLMERGRRMRSQAMHDYIVGLAGLLRRAFTRRDRKAESGHPMKARHA